MAFTYSGNPSASDRDAVRFMIQDTDSTDALMQDAEIDWLLAQVTNVYQAAHDACYALAAKFARKADQSKSVGDLSLSLNYASMSERYMTLANEFNELSARRDVPTPWANAESLKATRDRLITTHNTDIWLGQMDYRQA